MPAMKSDANPIPEAPGTVIPYLCIKDAASAIAFYKNAFGAAETMARITDSTGRVGHAEIRIGGSTIMLADEHPEHGFRSPQSLGAAHMLFFVNVPDVDAMVKRAVAAGGTLTRPVANQFYGHRTGEITDPFGYRWTLSTRIEDVPEEELLRRAAAEEQRRKAAGAPR
jgi:PhnB protein